MRSWDGRIWTRWATVVFSTSLGLLSEQALAQRQSPAPDPETAACLATNQKPDVVIESCTRLLERQSRAAARSLAVVLTIRGTALSVTGQMQDAANDFSAAVAIDPDFAPAYEVRGNLLRQNNQCDLAMADFDRTVALEPQRVNAHVARGLCLSGKGETERAEADFDEAIKLDPQNKSGATALAWNAKARMELQKGALELALADYDQAIKLDPKSAFAYTSRGDFFRTKGDYDKAVADYDKAVADYDKAVANQPDDLTGYGNRGLTRFYMGDYAKAADDFKRVVDGQPNAYSMLWLYLSRARTSTRDARDELAKAAEQLKSPDWPSPMVELFLGKKSLATAQAAASKPEEKCEAQFFVGEWRLLGKDRSEATKALQMAVDTCPKDFAEYAGAVAELKRLKQ
jgi:lipoprotein NlpI